MPNLDEILRGQQAENLMNNEKLGQLMDAPETQKLFTMLIQNTGGNLERAAGNAASGDTAQLISAIKQLMQNPEATRLVEQMKKKLK